MSPSVFSCQTMSDCGVGHPDVMLIVSVFGSAVCMIFASACVILGCRCMRCYSLVSINFRLIGVRCIWKVLESIIVSAMFSFTYVFIFWMIAIIVIRNAMLTMMLSSVKNERSLFVRICVRVVRRMLAKRM